MQGSVRRTPPDVVVVVVEVPENIDAVEVVVDVAVVVAAVVVVVGEERGQGVLGEEGGVGASRLGQHRLCQLEHEVAQRLRRLVRQRRYYPALALVSAMSWVNA